MLALLACGGAIAEDQVFEIRCEVSDGDRALGSPTVLVRSGLEATVSVSGTYTLSVIAEPSGPDQVKLSADIEVNGESHSPTMLLDLDNEATLQMGDIGFAVTVSRHAPDDA